MNTSTAATFKDADAASMNYILNDIPNVRYDRETLNEIRGLRHALITANAKSTLEMLKDENLPVEFIRGYVKRAMDWIVEDVEALIDVAKL